MSFILGDPKYHYKFLNNVWKNYHLDDYHCFDHGRFFEHLSYLYLFRCVDFDLNNYWISNWYVLVIFLIILRK